MRILSGALPLAFAAALGNALFVLGQRRAAGSAPAVVAIAAVVCAAGLAIAYVLAGRPMPDRTTAVWGIASGAGLLATFLGFQVLFARHGASSYTLYAVLAILTTSIGVGVVLGGEPVNRWHVASAACAIAAIVLFGVGRAR
jgi:drug/metabolite transporter (DMT)-like permease